DPAWHETDRLPPLSPASSVASFPSAATKESRPAIRGNLQNQKCKLPSPQASKACNLKTYLVRKIDSRSMPWQLFTDDPVGWVEQRETHHLRRAMSFAALNPSYAA